MNLKEEGFELFKQREECQRRIVMINQRLNQIFQEQAENELPETTGHKRGPEGTAEGSNQDTKSKK